MCRTFKQALDASQRILSNSGGNLRRRLQANDLEEESEYYTDLIEETEYYTDLIEENEYYAELKEDPNDDDLEDEFEPEGEDEED